MTIGDPLSYRNWGELESALDQAEKRFAKETRTDRYEFAVDTFICQADRLAQLQPSLFSELVRSLERMLTTRDGPKAFDEARTAVKRAREELLAALRSRRSQ